MSDTPRTDAALAERDSTVAVDAAFARQLESELTEAKDEIRRSGELHELRLHQRNQWRECAEQWRECAEELARTLRPRSRTFIQSIRDQAAALAKFDELEKGTE